MVNKKKEDLVVLVFFPWLNHSQTDGTGKLNLQEFKHLWRKIKAWQVGPFYQPQLLLMFNESFSSDCQYPHVLSADLQTLR